LAVTLAVSACGSSLRNTLQPSSKRVLFEGQYFPARLSRDRDDRAAFSVVVSRAGQGLNGAREAGRYEATKYCIDQYGNSDAVWSVGPDSAGLAVRDDQLTLAGRCAG
jgi:hypothetical protein